MASPRTSLRVAVIGGGTAGVIAARFMMRAGHRPKILEAGSSLGGIWADHAQNAVVYKNLQTNLPTAVMQSPDLDFPEGIPSYIDKRTLGRYIETYARVFGVSSLAVLGATVTRVTLASTGEAEDPWQVEWQVDGVTRMEAFGAVVVATGHYEEPFRPTLPGEAEWLAADRSRSIVHSREYDTPEAYNDLVVLVVGGRSSGFDITRMLSGHAKWVYILDKDCAVPATHHRDAVTHVPVGAQLCADGRMRLPVNVEEGGAMELIDGPPVEHVILATGYLYNFPFLDQASLGMKCQRNRFITPLYQHLMHTRYPTLGFVGMNLSVPCPIPFFECQSAFLAEHWARPAHGTHALTSLEQREQWLERRVNAVGERLQDLHFTSAGGGSPWGYMRELVTALHTVQPDRDSDCWLERGDWDKRLSIVESVYQDRKARYPNRPWDADTFRACDYTVNWHTGEWSVTQNKGGAPVE